MKVAIIGLGPHGKRLAQATREAGLELAAVVDAREEALAPFAEQPGAGRYGSTTALYAALIPDLVCIATNGPSHTDLAIEAMNRGVRRVLVEKPMACSLAECDRMMAIADEKGVRLAVDQSRRWDPMYRWLRDQIRSGRWGQPRAAWIQRPGIGLGCLATHSFDLVQFLFDKEPRAITAWVDEPVASNPRGERFVDPGGFVVMDFGPGLRATVAQIEDGAGPMSVELDLTGARVRIDEKSGELEVIARDLSIKPGPDRPPVFERLEVPSGLATRPSMPVMLTGVLKELASGGDMDCDARHGRSAVETLVAAHLSHQRGHVPQALPLVAEDREQWLPVT